MTIIKATKEFDLALKCPKCWGFTLFCDWVTGFREVGSLEFYDRQGQPPVNSAEGKPLCPKCGGYLDMHASRVSATPLLLRDELRASQP